MISSHSNWAHCCQEEGSAGPIRPSLIFMLDINVSLFLPLAIGNAYAVLSNPEKRQQYDQYGDQCPPSNVPHHSGHSRPGHYRSFYRDFEADISPEELFNIFFGGRFPTGVCVCGGLFEEVAFVSPSGAFSIV